MHANEQKREGHQEKRGLHETITRIYEHYAICSWMLVKFIKYPHTSPLHRNYLYM